jgi:hypothetical protein
MKLETAQFQFTQEVDSCATGLINELHVEISDAGGGPYVVLKTERWAIDVQDLPIFIKQLKDLVTQIECFEPPISEKRN